jgi:uncharacterized protein YdcH (DUF465 family)
MRHLIKLPGVTQKERFVLHEWAGRQFIFHWNDALGAYAYEPKDQAEADLIYSTPRQHCAWTFASHYIKEPGDRSPAELVAALQAKEAEVASLRAESEPLLERIAELEANVAELEAKLADRPKRTRKASPAPEAETAETPAEPALVDV